MKKHKAPQTLVHLKSLPKKRRQVFRQKLFEAWTSGVTAYKAAQQLRISSKCAYKLYARFAKEGEDAVAEKARGAKNSPRGILSPQEREKLSKAVSGGNPKQLKLFSLWSSRAVVAWVRETFGKAMSRRTARRLLRAMGFTYQCPVRRAREQDAAAVRKWLDEEYPAIRALAHGNKAGIFWADEATAQASATKARGYAPRGQSPVLAVPANRGVRCNYIAAVSNRGELYFETFETPMNAVLFKHFAEGLVADAAQPVVLIVDNLKVHHATCLADWFREMEEARKLWIRHLPSYSPELNPEEYLNRDVKADAAEKALPATAEGMVRQTREHLESRRRDRAAVRRVAFGHPAVRYAADN